MALSAVESGRSVPVFQIMVNAVCVCFHGENQDVVEHGPFCQIG